MGEHTLMAQWSSLIITDDGLWALQEAIANAKRLQFTKAVIGAGVPEEGDIVFTFNDVKESFIEMAVSSGYAKSDYHMITVLLDNKDLESDLFIREIAIKAMLEGIDREFTYDTLTPAAPLTVG